MTNNSLIEELEAELRKPHYEGLTYESGLRKAIAIARRPDTEAKVIAAANAEPIPVPADKDGYFAWLKGPRQPAAFPVVVEYEGNCDCPDGHDANCTEAPL